MQSQAPLKSSPHCDLGEYYFVVSEVDVLGPVDIVKHFSELFGQESSQSLSSYKFYYQPSVIFITWKQFIQENHNHNHETLLTEIIVKLKQYENLSCTVSHQLVCACAIASVTNFQPIITLHRPHPSLQANSSCLNCVHAMVTFSLCSNIDTTRLLTQI